MSIHSLRLSAATGALALLAVAVPSARRARQ